MIDDMSKNELVKGLFSQQKLSDIMISDDTTQDEFDKFLDLFGQSLSHKSFMTRNRDKSSFSSLFTPSDEAFLIFTLNRCWNAWYSEYILKEGIGRKGRYAYESSNKKHSGFKVEGIMKFNKLCQEIKDWRTNPKRVSMEQSYMEKYIRYEKNELTNDIDENILANMNSKKPKKNKILAYTDLGNFEEQAKQTNVSKYGES